MGERTTVQSRPRSGIEMTPDDRLKDYRIRSKNYGRYVRTYSDPRLHGKMLRELRGLDLEEAEVLDLGSGIGLSTIHLKGRVKDIYYLDRSCEMIEEGLNRGIVDPDRVIIHDFTKERLPFDGGRFDVIVARYCIHDVENKLKLFSEINRVLTPTGLFQMVDMCAVDEPSRALYNRIHGWKTHSDYRVDTFIESLETYAELMKRSGMTTVSCSFYRSPVYTAEWVLENQITEDRKRLIEQIVLDGIRSQPSLRDFFIVKSTTNGGLYIEFPVVLLTAKKEVYS